MSIPDHQTVSPLPGNVGLRRWPAWSVLVAVLLLLGAGGWHRQAIGSYNGDEPTFLAMTASLAEDGDLAVHEVDRQRLPTLLKDQPWMLILQRSDAGVSYSKPIAYPLLAAPFYRLLGPVGLIVLNVLALGLAFLLARCWLARVGPPAAADWTLVSVAGASVLLPYMGWMMSDALQIACALGGSVLAVGRGLGFPQGFPARHRWLDSLAAALVGGLLLGLLVTLRYPNGVILVAVAAALLAAGRWRRMLAVLGAAAAAFVLLSVLTAEITGSWNPYGARRSAFRDIAELPIDGPDAGFREHFDEHPARHHLDWRYRLEPLTSAYSTLYFLIGRHTGLLVYFPAVLVLLPVALRRGDRVSWCLLAGFAALAAFYLLWLPRNYFGGGTFLGNRYILTGIPLLLLALPRLPRPRAWIPVWGIALLAATSAALSMAQPGVDRTDVQNHAYAGIFRLLPYESVAQSIGPGRRDRYWAGDLVRFVDPFAQRRAADFRLLAGAARPAELMVATARDPGALTLHVRSPHPQVDLLVRDWGATRRMRLGPRAHGIHELVRIEPAPAWRRHPFWWQRRPAYQARLLRLTARDPSGRPVEASITYLGDGGLLRACAWQVMSAEVPEAGIADDTLPIRVRLRNMSPIEWRLDGVAPVRLGWRFVSRGPGQRAGQGRLRLSQPVPSGGSTEIAGDLPLPGIPGAYRLRLDLILGEIRWCASDVGEPVAEPTVIVRSPSGG